MSVPSTTADRPATGPTSGESRSLTVAVVGGTGYTGALTAELILGHPHADLVAISSEQSAGSAVNAFNPRLRTGLAFCPEAGVGDVDVAFVCTPHGEAARVVKRLLDDGTKVVDLSADFRLAAGEYAEWYGPHPHPELLPGVYGLTELHRDEIAAADLVANPGCYPTAALLALTPLKAYGLLDVVVDAKSGVSGAGKSPSARSHFCSIDSDLMAYGVRGHRHFPEIAAGIAAGGGGAGQGQVAVPATPAKATTPSLTFIPHLVPLQRGITETIYVRAERLPQAAELRARYESFYAGERFVEICAAPPELKDVTGTNYCRIFVTVDERAQRIIVIAAIDNLMKGAAGQAVQNMNVMCGLPEHEGLV